MSFSFFKPSRPRSPQEVAKAIKDSLTALDTKTVVEVKALEKVSLFISHPKFSLIHSIIIRAPNVNWAIYSTHFGKIPPWLWNLLSFWGFCTDRFVQKGIFGSICCVNDTWKAKKLVYITIKQKLSNEEDWIVHNAHLLLLAYWLAHESSPSKFFSDFDACFILHSRHWKKSTRISELWGVCFAEKGIPNPTRIRFHSWCKKYVRRTLLLFWFTS